MSLSFDGVLAFDRVGFDVARGEVCALIGPNGAGKSSLLNVVSGLYPAGAGSVRFEGREISARRRARGARSRANLPELALFRGMTVLENVALGKRLSRKSDIPRTGLPSRARAA